MISIKKLIGNPCIPINRHNVLQKRCPQIKQWIL